MKKLIACCALVILSAGCAPATKPEPEPMTNIDFSKADYGNPPADYKLKIKSWLESNLKDPESAKVSEPTALRKEVAFENKQAIFGYTTCMGINAKNSYGGYTGIKGYWFFFHKGRIVRAQQTDVYPGMMIFRGHNVTCE